MPWAKKNQMNQPQRQRINNFTAAALVCTALVFDLCSFVMGFIAMDWFVSLMAWPIFGIWLYLLGVGFLSPKRFAIMLATVTVGAIPFVAMLPELTLGIIAMIGVVKSEDKLGIKVPLAGKAK